MNKIFKVVWNRTIQSFVVTSELAKGRVKSSAEQNSTDVSAESGKNGIATVFRLTVISAALLGAGNSYAATAPRGQIAFDPPTSATAVSGATATGIGALSVGASANATANGAVAVGTSANATHNNSLAVGTNAKATQNHAVAMGADTSASSSHATAIGKSANAVSTDSTALGADSKANGTQATAVGKNALANNTSTTALGNSAQAFGIGSMALGQSSTSRGQDGIAIGSGSQAAANAQNAIAIGTNAVGYQSESIAIGNSAQAQTGNTIAIGKSAVANSPASGNAASSAIALGADANATGLGTIAIGRASEVLSQNSMNVNVTHNNIAIGNTARVGDSSSSKITQSIAIGSGNRVDPQGRPEGAWAKGDQSIAVGGNVLANGHSSVAIGGDDLDLVGGTRYSGNATDKFIKYNEKGAKTGEYALSGKSLRDIYKEMTGDTMNYGSYGNTIAGQGSVALGVQSNSSADLSLAIGTKSQATAFGSVALGTGAKATLLNSVALGTASKTDKEGKAYVQREIMGVTYTWAGGQTTDAGDVVSVGSKGYERQIINVSPGDISATSTDAINGSQLYGVLSALERVRYFSVKSTDGSTDGTKNWNNDGAKGANSIAIGPSASTTSAATNGIAIGNQANVTGVNAVALGNGTTASVQDSVALGNGAVGAANNFDATAKNASFKNDSGAATNVSYAASSSSTTGAVSVGSAGNERQIQNVAAGRISATSTDAVNGSQLYTVMNNVGHNIQQNGTDKSRINNNGTVNYADGNLTTVAVTDGENASKVQINVTQGSLSVDNNGTVSAPTAGVATAGDVANAINNAKTTTKVEAGSNAHVNKTTSGKETTYTVSADKATVQVSSALNLTSNTTTAADGAVTTNYSIDLAQSTKDDIQKGVDAKTTVDTKGLTFNGDSGSTNVEKLGSTVTVAGDDNITTEAQDDKVTVKLNKDLVVDSVKAGDTTVNNDGVKVGDDVALTQDGVKAGDVKLTKDGLNNAGNKVTNVAAGTDDTDAVNYGQLKETNANVAKGLNIAADNGNDDNVQLGETVAYRSSDKNIVTTVSDNQIDFKLAKDITVDSVTAGDSKLNTDGLTITGGPSVTKAGIHAAGNKITNVAPGTDDTDAVNYSQLKQQSAAARTEVAAGTNIKDVVKTTGANGQDVYTVNAKGTTASAGSSKVTVTAAEKADNVTDYSIDLAQDTKDDIQKGVDAKTTVDSKGLTFNGDSGSTNVEKLGSTVTVAGDDNITTEAQDDKVTVKLNKDLVVDSVKAGDTTVNNDGVKVGDDVALTQDGVKAGDVKLTKDGLNNAGNKVTNVADGDLNADSKDAVNGSQLFATNQNVANNAANIAKGINFGGTTGSNNYALGDTINVKGDSNIISETVAGGAQLKLADVLNVGQAAPVKIDGDKGEVSGLSNTTLGGSDFAQGKRAATEEQLNAAQDQLVNVLGGNAANNGGNISMTDIGGTGENNIHDAIKAVNATANLPLTFGGDSGKDVERKPGTKLNIVGGQTDAAKLSDGNIGVVANGSDKLEVKLAKDLAVDSVKAGDTTVNTDGVKVGDVNLTKAGLNNGGNKITNVAAGTDDTDAVNVAQLNKAAAAAKTEVVQGDNIVVTQDVGANGQTIYKVATDKNLKVDSVTAGDTVMNNDGVKVGDDVALNKDGLKAGDVNLTKAGLNNGGNKITNVAAGTDDTDAVNVSQLKQAAAASKTEVVQGKNIVVTEKTGDKGQTVYEVATDKDLDVDSVKAGDTTVNNDGVKVGDDVALTQDGVKAGDVKLTKNGLNNAGNKVTNVADGDINANSKDAVNGSQLYATNQNVANNAATIAKGINFGGTSGSNNYSLGDTINVKGDSNIISETVAGGAQLKLADEISVKTVNADTFKAGDTVMNNDGVKVGDKVALNKDGLTAGNTVVNNDGVTIAAPTENNPNNQVKLSPVGLNNGGQRITNVAPGKDGTDAANVNQLIGLGTELQNNINQVGKKAYAGVAGAIAQGSIPQVTRPGATGIGVGSGYYGGQSAMAIGVSAMSDGGNWIVKGNFSANTDGHVGVGAGALYQW